MKIITHNDSMNMNTDMSKNKDGLPNWAVNISNDAKYEQYVNENTRSNCRSDIQADSKTMNGRYLAKLKNGKL